MRAAVFVVVSLLAVCALGSPFSHNHEIERHLHSAELLEHEENFSIHRSTVNLEEVNQVATSVNIVTWNAGNTEPSSDDATGVGAFFAHLPDIVVVGAQESTYTRPVTTSFYSILTTKATAKGYTLLGHTTVGANHHIQIFAFLRNAVPNVALLNTFSVRTDKWSYKGGAGVVLIVNGNHVAFITAHLSAHMKAMYHRNDNVQEIIKGSHIIYKDVDISLSAEYVFWFGDLNYRLDAALVNDKVYPNEDDDDQPNFETDHATILASVNAGAYADLIANNDQLQNQLRAGRLLYEFAEVGAVNFKPTFKLVSGASEATVVYSTHRIPSYCDRVLVHTLPGIAVPAITYGPLWGITTSDHRPVHASFTLTTFSRPANIEARDATHRVQISGSVKGSGTATDYIASHLKTDRTFFFTLQSPSKAVTGNFPQEAHTSVINGVRLQIETPILISIGDLTTNTNHHVVITLYKHNKKGSKNKPIGSFTLSLHDIAGEPDGVRLRMPLIVDAVPTEYEFNGNAVVLQN